MRRAVSELDRQFDLLVIGGGIFGACAALDAAQRGLAVALIESKDFGGATSANPFKLLHGGLRYLQHCDIARVRYSARARKAFLRVAPHLCVPLPVVVPTYGHGLKSKATMRAAMALYDTITWDRNVSISDDARQIPRGYTMSRGEVCEQYPGLNTAGLTGAAVFHDGQMLSPPRLVLAAIRSAVEQGAVVTNYVEAVGAKITRRRITCIDAYDKIGRESLSIRAKVVLNTAGPYAERWIRDILGTAIAPPTCWSRDAYLVVARSLLRGDAALAIPAQTSDPDALISRGPRHLFLTPWRGHTLVGVWHKVFRGDPDACGISDQEAMAYIDEINRGYAGIHITHDDISMYNSGLIPFGENDPTANNLRFAHRSRLVDHGNTHGVDNLLTLIGVRYTTASLDVMPAIDRIIAKTGKPRQPSVLDKQPWYGGNCDTVNELIERANSDHPSTPAHAMRALVQHHGTQYGQVLRVSKTMDAMRECITGSSTLRASVAYAARHEMAVHLSDVVCRRTDLGTGHFPGHAAIEEAANVMGHEHGWDSETCDAEINDTLAQFPCWSRSVFRCNSQRGIEPREASDALR